MVVTGKGPPRDPKADKAWQQLEQFEKARPSLPSVGLPLILTYSTFVEDLRPEAVSRMVDKVTIPDHLKKADKARDFYQRFPNYFKAWDARIWEYEHLSGIHYCMSAWSEAEQTLEQNGLLGKAQVRSFTNLEPRLLALEKILLNNTNLSRSNQFLIRRDRLGRLADGPGEEWWNAAKELQQDFPRNENSYDYLWRLIEESDDDRKLSLATDTLNSAAPQGVKARVRAILRQLDGKGKPVSLHFTAVDGQEVDTAKMRGKVLLIAFWEPDERLELLLEKATYARFHAQGLETIGICVGQANQKLRLTNLLKEEKITWPQYFDGIGWKNGMAQGFGIIHTPALLLVDKQGMLREIITQTAGIIIEENGITKRSAIVRASNPPGDLGEKIKRLLAEPWAAP